MPTLGRGHLLSDGTAAQAVPGARGRVDIGRVESARDKEPGPEAERDAADASSPESGRDGAEDEHVDADEFGGAALARAAKDPRPKRSAADTAPDRRQTKKREARMRERQEEENRRERRARRRDMIDDPVLFAQCVVWREGHFSKRQQQWVLQEEDSSEKHLTAARHHERACKALAFWTGAENRSQTSSREDVSPMHALVIQMAAATMGENHIHRKNTDKGRSPLWMCVVAAAHDLGLLGNKVTQENLRADMKQNIVSILFAYVNM